MTNNNNPINPIDALFDEDNNDVIVLFNERGEEVPFEQIALIPIAEKIYVILKPVNAIEGVGEDEGLVFSVEENADGAEYLMLVTDEKIIDDVFAIYDELVEAEEEE
jgi:uncharacterized protein YrzB (UPF0473 family)